MEKLAILTTAESEPVDYKTRLTVKAIVIDEHTNVALYSGLLLGGGVEDGESSEEALHRECMEEAGLTIKIIRPLGVVLQYRDEFRKRYEVHGFFAQALTQGVATTKQEDEIDKTAEWVSIDGARNIFETRISELESNTGMDKNKDSYQGRLYNTKTALIFLNEAAK